MIAPAGFRRITEEDLFLEAKERFGPDPREWRFVCPGCGDVATSQEYPETQRHMVGQACVGRYLEGRGCDWVSYGLIGGPWQVVKEDGTEMCCFALAEAG